MANNVLCSAFKIPQTFCKKNVFQIPFSYLLEHSISSSWVCVALDFVSVLCSWKLVEKSSIFMLLFVSRTRAKLTFTFQIFLLLGSISFTNDKLEIEGRVFLQYVSRVFYWQHKIFAATFDKQNIPIGVIIWKNPMQLCDHVTWPYVFSFEKVLRVSDFLCVLKNVSAHSAFHLAQNIFKA